MKKAEMSLETIIKFIIIIAVIIIAIFIAGPLIQKGADKILNWTIR